MIKIIEKINGLPVGFKKTHNIINFFKADGTYIKDEDLTKENSFSEFINFVNTLKDNLKDDEYVIGKLLTSEIKQNIEIRKSIMNDFIVYKTNIDKDFIQEHFDLMRVIYESEEFTEDVTDFLKEMGEKPIPNVEWTKKILEKFENPDYQPFFNEKEMNGITVIINGETFDVENPKILNIKKSQEDVFKPDINDIRKERLSYKDICLNINTVEFTNNPKENLRRYLIAIINAVRDTVLIDEEMFEEYKLNYDEFEKLGLDDIYISAKGTKAENVIYYFLNLLRDELPEKSHILSINDNKKINYLRNKFNFDKIYENKRKTISVFQRIFRENIRK